VQFEVERTTVAGRPALTVRGELDLATCTELADVIESQLAAAPRALVLDLTPTRFIDSSGARCLVRAAKRATAAGIPLHVICPRSNSPVRLVIDLLELERVVPIVESPSDIGTAVAEGDGRP
jgi:anti-sigma B factor antagonist